MAALWRGRPDRLVRHVFVSVIVCGLAYAQPYRLVLVHGSSMTPTLRNGAPLLMNARFDRSKLQRNDIVVFRHQGETYVKRVAYLGCDQIELIRHRGVRADWAALYYPQPGEISSNWDKSYRRVPRGSVFVLSDNATEDTDSRSLGPIPVGEIEGVIAGSWPNPNEWVSGPKTTQYMTAHLAALKMHRDRE